ncbi:MAG: DNA-directed RNA polymerase subunit omega [Clostridia bacterium]
MITKPSIDELTEIAGNKYILCCAVSKRAKELNVKQMNDELATNIKTITYAAQELKDGRIKIVDDED